MLPEILGGAPSLVAHHLYVIDSIRRLRDADELTNLGITRLRTREQKVPTAIQTTEREVCQAHYLVPVRSGCDRL